MKNSKSPRAKSVRKKSEGTSVKVFNWSDCGELIDPPLTDQLDESLLNESAGSAAMKQVIDTRNSIESLLNLDDNSNWETSSLEDLSIDDQCFKIELIEKYVKAKGKSLEMDSDWCMDKNPLVWIKTKSKLNLLIAGMRKQTPLKIYR